MATSYAGVSISGVSFALSSTPFPFTVSCFAFSLCSLSRRLSLFGSKYARTRVSANRLSLRVRPGQVHSRFSPKTVVLIPRRGASYDPGITRCRVHLFGHRLAVLEPKGKRAKILTCCPTSRRYPQPTSTAQHDHPQNAGGRRRTRAAYRTRTSSARRSP